MDRRQVIGAVFLLVCASIPVSALAEPSDATYDALLGKYVLASPDGVNRVDYKRWKAVSSDVANLDAYIRELSARTPLKMPRDEAFAFWCNLYNAITLKVVLDRYPVGSIQDIKSDGLFDPKAYFGPWRTKRITVESRSYSLDDIENNVLRRVFKDPRVHYAINCASYSCPNLRNRAWTAATLSADLDQAARDYVNHPRGVTIFAGNKLRVSSIYKWFAEDFGGTDARKIAHLRKYAGPKLAAALASNPRISEDGYDWSLNDGKRDASSR
ncbi:MAG: DUF547 domain-containing protein [Rhodospirillales bacterium]|nr:DUF547 domain-containing protein [Rhodospirillales bacterium]